jgi:cell division septal protein FtsQ
MAGRRFIDFHRKNYRNPFFKKSGFRNLKDRREKKTKMWRRKIVLFFLLAVAIGWVWFLFYSPYFKIEKVEISGLERIEKNEIKNIVDSQISNRRFLIFKQNNLFLFDKDFLFKSINAKYVLDGLIIEKKLPNALLIQIKEKNSKIIWVTNDKNYNLDLSGVIIGETAILPDPETEKSLPVIYDDNNKEVAIGEKVLGEEQVSAVIELTEKISQFTNVEIDSYKLINEKELRAIAKEGWYILFADSNIENQLKKLDLVLKEKIKDQRKSLEYVDLRFEDRVYYK